MANNNKTRVAPKATEKKVEVATPSFKKAEEKIIPDNSGILNEIKELKIKLEEANKIIAEFKAAPSVSVDGNVKPKLKSGYKFATAEGMPMTLTKVLGNMTNGDVIWNAVSYKSSMDAFVTSFTEPQVLKLRKIHE